MTASKRILVTGANGFLGRHCLPALIERGFDVVAPYIGSALESEFSDVKWAPCDLLDAAQVSAVFHEARATHLLHLAWPMSPSDPYNSPQNADGVIGGIHAFRAFADAGGRRAVVAGTCAEYDWSHDVLRETETPRRPSTLYGVCKHHCRCLFEALADRAGLSVAWGHLFFLYGPHESPHRLVPYVINSLLRGETASCTDGTQIRDYLHAADAADALVHLVDGDLTGPVNIASGTGVRIRDVIERIGAITERPELIRLGDRPIPEHEVMTIRACVRRLRDEASWRPRYTLEQGLEQTVDWWKQTIEAVGA